MKHVTFGEKSFLIGDVAADTLIEYAALLAEHTGGDSVDLAAVSGDGDQVVTTLLLNPGATLMAETTHSSLPEPDNDAAVAEMRAKIQRITSPPPASEVPREETSSWAQELGLL